MQGLHLRGLDEIVASATREITMHFDFDLVPLTLAGGRDRSNSAFNHRLIWLRQHAPGAENDKDHIQGRAFFARYPNLSARQLVSCPFHPFSGNFKATFSENSNFFIKLPPIWR